MRRKLVVVGLCALLLSLGVIAWLCARSQQRASQSTKNQIVVGSDGSLTFRPNTNNFAATLVVNTSKLTNAPAPGKK